MLQHKRDSQTDWGSTATESRSCQSVNVFSLQNKGLYCTDLKLGPQVTQRMGIRGDAKSILERMSHIDNRWVPRNIHKHFNLMEW